MFLGFLTGGQLGNLSETLKWAEEHGFKAISITLPINTKFIDVDEALQNPAPIKEAIEASPVIVSAIGFYGNPIHPDQSTRKAHKEHLLKVIELTYKLEVPVVTGWIGKHPGTIEDNIREIGKEWPEILSKAEDLGLKIAIENCPGNIMYRSDIWARVFELLGSEALGLEFDPSHLICQLIDANEAADEFGDRIYHVHAKDAQVLWKKVRKTGITDRGWCPHRLPGWGDLDWREFFSVLQKHGYDYAISIEHEDPYFDYKTGLILAKKFLEQLMP